MNYSMTNDNIIDILPKTNRKWWIKFIKQTGKIMSISSKRITEFNDSESILETESQICRDLVRGRKNKNNYAVLWDPLNNIWTIDTKSDTLVIKTRSNKLEQVSPYIAPIDTDLHASISKTTGEIKVSVNLERIATHLHLSKIKNLITEDNKLIDLYLTKKNNPDCLIKIVNLDSEELIIRGYTIAEIGNDITATLDWTDISLYTKPYFEKYSMDFVSTSLNDTPTDIPITNIQRASLVENSDTDAEINIQVLNGNIVIRSNLTTQQLYFFKKKKLILHICNNSIDYYIGTITLDAKDICSNKDIIFKAPSFWPESPLITFKNSKIRIHYHMETKNDTND